MGLAQFNSPGKRDDKLRLMFRLHDDDEDGLLTAEDVVEYLKVCTPGRRRVRNGGPTHCMYPNPHPIPNPNLTLTLTLTLPSPRFAIHE